MVDPLRSEAAMTLGVEWMGNFAHFHPHMRSLPLWIASQWVNPVTGDPFQRGLGNSSLGTLHFHLGEGGQQHSFLHCKTPTPLSLPMLLQRGEREKPLSLLCLNNSQEREREVCLLMETSHVERKRAYFFTFFFA